MQLSHLSGLEHVRLEVRDSFQTFFYLNNFPFLCPRKKVAIFQDSWGQTSSRKNSGMLK